MSTSMKELLQNNNANNKIENEIDVLSLFRAMRNFYEFGVNEVYIFGALMSMDEFKGSYSDLAKLLGFRINGNSVRLALLELNRFGLVDVKFKYTDKEVEELDVKRNMMTSCKLNDNWVDVITSLDLYSDVTFY